MKALLIALTIGITPPTGLYRTAGAFLRQSPTLAGVDAFANVFHTKIVIVNRSSQEVCRTKFAYENTWGYVDGNGKAWRIVKNEAYKLVQTADSFTLYSRYTGGKYGHGTSYYFSDGLAGNIYELRRGELSNVFGERNPVFAHLVNNLRWYQSLTGTDGPRDKYRVVALYRQVNGK